MSLFAQSNRVLDVKLGQAPWNEKIAMWRVRKDLFWPQKNLKWFLGLWLWAWFVCRLETLILTTSGTLWEILITTTPMPWSQLKHTTAWKRTVIFRVEIVVHGLVTSSLLKCTRRWETLILIASIQMLAFTVIPQTCSHCGRKRTRWVQYVLGYDLV